MKKLIAVFMICLTQVAFAQEGGVSKATAAYSTACEILHNAQDAEKANDIGDAIIAYHMADEKFSQVRKQDPSYESQHVDEYKKSIAEAIGRLEPASQEPPPPPKKQQSILAVIISQTIGLAICLQISLIAMPYYRERRYPLRDKYHTFWPRLWTGFVDSCVLWPVAIFIIIINRMPVPAVAAVAGVLVGQMTYWCYTVIMHAKYGQTVGKMACLVKVVDAKTEKAITFRQALLREGIPIVMSLGGVGYRIYFLWTGRPDLQPYAADGNKLVFWIVAVLPSLWFLVEVVTMLTNKRRRALHDLIAGTVVLRTNINEEINEQQLVSKMGRVREAGFDY